MIEIDDDPSEAEIRSARVHFHSTDRDEAEAAALRLPVPRHLGVFFTGKLVDPRPCPDVMKFRYSAVHHLVVVWAEVRGPGGIRTGYLAVDTGTIYTMVRPAFLAAVGADESADIVTLATVGGVTSASRVRLPFLRSLGVERSDLAVVARDLPRGLRIDGLLGLDFLRGSRLTIDFRRGEIDLET